MVENTGWRWLFRVMVEGCSEDVAFDGRPKEQQSVSLAKQQVSSS